MIKIRTTLARILPVGSFSRNVITLMTGTTFAQALMILVAPILTRLYSPEDFGIYALYISILGILAVVACWRYELAIVLPEKDEDAANVLLLSIIISFGMAILTLILVAIFRVQLAQLLSAPELTDWLWFLPISLFTTGLFQAFNYWSTRRKRFNLLAIRQITNSTITVATQLGASSVLHLGPGGLIAGSILGQFVATSRLAWHTCKFDCELIRNSLSIDKLKVIIREYKRFPLYLSFAGLMNVSSAQIPTILLGYYFDSTIVGFFSLSSRVVALPLSVVGGSVAQVFFPQASEAYRDGELDIIILKTFTKLFSFISVPILLLMIAGPNLVSLLFGIDWKLAGEYLVWLAPRFLVQFISSPLAMVFLILQRQDLNLKIDTMLFITNIGIIMLGGLLGDSFMTIKLYGMGTFLCYAIACFIIFRISGVSATTVFHQIIGTLFHAIPYIIFPWLTVLLHCGSEIVTVTALLCGMVFLLCNARGFLKTA